MGSLARWEGMVPELLGPWSDMDRMFRIFGREWMDEHGGSVFNPPVEISEQDDSYLIVTELPGVDKKDIKVTLEDGVLTIAGEKRVEKEERKKGRYHLVERGYGSFQRSFRLGTGVTQDKVDARFKDGILTVTVPKSPETKPREIAVKD